VARVHRWGAALVGAAICVAVAVPAAAHTELIGSSPADGATLTTAPAEVLLEFSQPVQTEFGQVVVLDDTGAHHEQGDPQIMGAIVTQSLGKLVAGAYQISYRVGAADGHPITGTLTFTVASAPAVSEPNPSTSSDPHEGMDHADRPLEATTPAAQSAAAGGRNGTLLLAGGGIAVAAVLGAVLYVALDRRRPGRSGDAAEAEQRQ
jgi:copper resistance protein C